ncbi:MAG: amidohydrolase family protein [Dehalococcoidia bacterium]|nr:amidohydrolase family protein [Dehalococcoidia bacterium]
MFIFDCECHMLPLADDINYFPYYKMNQWALRSLLRGLAPLWLYGVRDRITVEEMRDITRRRAGKETGESAAALVEKMDESGAQMACVLPESFLPMSCGVRMMSTNGWLAREIEKYPDRLVGVCNVGPIISRGVKNAVWELEYLVKELNFKAVKFYPVDDVPINDERLWPYYEKIQQLGIPLFIHTGFSWCVPGRSANCLPWLLEDVCEEFPGITILAYHLGYPFTDAMNICAAKYPNLYVGTSMLPVFGHGLSVRAQILLAEAIMHAGIDRIVWGTDMGANVGEVELLEKFQISKEVQRDYGYPAISEEDRAKWAGLNLARILKITPPELK